jgi:hypothetical protein
MISVPLVAEPHVVVTDGSFVGMAYNSRVLENWNLMSMNQVFSSGFFLDEVVC